MNTLNKKQIEQLDSVNFGAIYQAVKNQKYAFGINCGFTMTLTKVYEEATGQKLQHWSCNSCVFNNIKKVGQLYDTSMTELNDVEEVVPAKVQTTKKRGGRKSKK